jgi:hypothetical protein
MSAEKNPACWLPLPQQMPLGSELTLSGGDQPFHLEVVQRTVYESGLVVLGYDIEDDSDDLVHYMAGQLTDDITEGVRTEWETLDVLQQRLRTQKMRDMLVRRQIVTPVERDSFIAMAAIPRSPLSHALEISYIIGPVEAFTVFTPPEVGRLYNVNSDHNPRIRFYPPDGAYADLQLPSGVAADRHDN